jgi:hypothetical protein
VPVKTEAATSHLPASRWRGGEMAGSDFFGTASEGIDQISVANWRQQSTG